MLYLYEKLVLNDTMLRYHLRYCYICAAIQVRCASVTAGSAFGEPAVRGRYRQAGGRTASGRTYGADVRAVAGHTGQVTADACNGIRLGNGGSRPVSSGHSHHEGCDEPPLKLERRQESTLRDRRQISLGRSPGSATGSSDQRCWLMHQLIHERLVQQRRPDH
jgi:hypothetical protein